MVESKLFSIITVCRNDLARLARTWESIACQSFGMYEWLVVDGASTDGTPDYLSGITDPKLRWISEPDSGLYDAMNKGIDMAEGDYLLFLNAGDELASNVTLQRLADFIANNGNPNFIYGDAYERTVDGNLLYKRSRSHRWLWYGMFAHHQSMLYRRNALGRIRYSEQFKIGADYAFTAEYLLKNNNNAAKYPEPICVFEQGGVSAQMAAIGRMDQWKVRKDILKMNFVSRMFIWNMQIIVHALRTNFRWLYNKIRFSSV